MSGNPLIDLFCLILLACLVGIFLSQLPNSLRQSREREQQARRDTFQEEYRRLINQEFDSSRLNEQTVERLCEVQIAAMQRNLTPDHEIAAEKRWWRENSSRVLKWLAERQEFAEKHGAKPRRPGQISPNPEKQSYEFLSSFPTLLGIVSDAARSGVERRPTFSWLPVYAETKIYGVPRTRSYNGEEWVTDLGGNYDYTEYHVYPFLPNPDYVRQMNLYAEAMFYALWLPHSRDEGIPIGIYDPKGSCVFEGVRYRSYADEGLDFDSTAQKIMQQFEALPRELQLLCITR